MNRLVQLQNMTEIFRFFNLEEPVRHPLIGIVDFSRVTDHVPEPVSVSASYYAVIFKQYRNHSIRYGRRPVDFQDGSLICMAPGQVLDMDPDTEASENKGWGLFFHPDLVRAGSLGGRMKEFSFFSYEVSEALHLSEKERQVLYDCIGKIGTELEENIDPHSQAIVVAAIELLLQYCQRFYGRQFITRSHAHHTVVVQVEQVLHNYFKNVAISEKGLPTVKYLAEQVHLSPGYLSDLLRKETGKTAQDHIHFCLIEEAKTILLNTDKPVGEIAYMLGFEYPQYFNKLFKQKTGKTPVAFRNGN